MSGSLPYNYKSLLEKRKNLLATLQAEISTLTKSQTDLIRASENDTIHSRFAEMQNDFEKKNEEEKNDASLQDKFYFCPTDVTLKLNAFKIATDSYKTAVENAEKIETRTSFREAAKTAATNIENAVRNAYDLFDELPDFNSLDTLAKNFNTLIEACKSNKSSKNFSDFLANEIKLHNIISNAITEQVNSINTIENKLGSSENARLEIGKIFVSTNQQDADIVVKDRIIEVKAVINSQIEYLDNYIREKDAQIDEIRKRVLPGVEQMFAALPENIPSVTKTSSPSNSPSLGANNDRRDSPSKIVVPVSQANNHFSKFKPAENKADAANNNNDKQVKRGLFSRIMACSS